MKKKTKSSKQPKKLKELNLYDTDHPFRRTAIDIIKEVLEPLFQKGMEGHRYFNLEDNLTETINKRLKKFTNDSFKLDTTDSKRIRMERIEF